ncbi:MAG: GAP family protein [Chloroflexota bacterium]|nr:GAP family protein [Chloroflexota bacterium]
MISTIIALLPMIIGSAIVPMQIIMLLLMLTSESKGLSKAIAFVSGMTLVRLAQGVVFGLVFTGGEGATETGSEGSSWIVSTLLTVLGILLLISFYKALTGEADPDAPPPKWMAMLDGMTPLLALGVGAGLLLIGAKMWVFTLSAIGIIGEAAIGQPSSSIAFLIFVLLAESLLILPILVRIILPSKSSVWLGSLSAWLEKYNRQIVMVASLIFGLLFLYKGVSGFF